MKPANRRFLLPLFGVAIVSILLSALAMAGTIVLQNDNGDFALGSIAGRLRGDIDGAVYTPDEYLFPITIQAVQFAFHRPLEEPVPWIGDTARVRVQIYAVQDGAVGEILAESGPQTFSDVDTWLSVSLPSPLIIEEPGSFMAAVKWEAGSEDEAALPLALDSNFTAPQSEKNAKNLFHRVRYSANQKCEVGFCTHEELNLTYEGQSVGFNMIRVKIDSPAVTPTPTTTPEPTRTPTKTKTPTPQPTPSGHTDLHLPLVMRNHNVSLQALRVGNGAGDAVGHSLTSGAGLADQCWPARESNNLWVGREPADGRGLMRSVLRFDLSSIPTDVVVQQADLRLVVVEAEGHDVGEMAISIHNVTQDWADCPTWNTLADAVGPAWGTDTVGAGVEVYTVDVTPLARAWLRSELPNHGLILRGDEVEVGQMRGFVPTASSQEDLRPNLVLQYYRP